MFFQNGRVRSVMKCTVMLVVKRYLCKLDILNREACIKCTEESFVQLYMLGDNIVNFIPYSTLQ